MTSPMKSLPFQVHRRQPELITPARPTPREVKELSDIDDQDGLRYPVSFVQIYPNNPSMKGVDPASVIREALAQALVYYYPLAGRLREGPTGKLSVDCNGEGVLFVEADADAELELLGVPPELPFPCSEEFIFHVPGAVDILKVPLIAFEVTRFKCNGFTLTHRFTHCIADGFGTNQFFKAISEFARGATAPSVNPVWSRHLFNARDPPSVTCALPEYDHDSLLTILPIDHPTVERYFFFGPSEVSALRRFAPAHLLPKPTTFELITACLWRCRVRALGIAPDDDVRLHIAVNARGVFASTNTPQLPEGFYGNTFICPAAVAAAGQICENRFAYALGLVREAKARVTREYIQSTADRLATKGRRPRFSLKNAYYVSDATALGFEGVDYGWGKPVFGGPVSTEEGTMSYYMLYKNKNGDVGRLVSLGLPEPAMDKFVQELGFMLGTD